MGLLLDALTTPALPAWMLATALYPRWRVDHGERWGRVVPAVQPGAIWVHAASVGENVAAASIVARLPGPILWTADTETGVAAARRAVADRREVVVAARPVDHPFTLAPAWSEARPRAIVFVEGTYWPALAGLGHRSGVPVFRVAATAGRRTQGFGLWMRMLWDPRDRVIARDAEASTALARVYRRDIPIGGDPKFDRSLGPPAVSFARPFAVGASTRPGDEERLLDATASFDGTLVLAPRHLNRTDDVAASLDRRGVRYARRSAWTSSEPVDVDVLLLDTLGELPGLLRGARFVFVGGTFDETIGGHSPVEAWLAGAPIVAGPAIGSHASLFAASGASVDADLAAAIRLARPPPCPPTGAAERIAHFVLADLGSPAPESSPRPWAAPLALAVAIGSAARHAPWDFGIRTPKRVSAPVISLGSTNARSPGRTSTVRAIVGLLAQHGHQVGVAVRGYRRGRADGAVALCFSGADADPRDLGDEGCLLANAGAWVAAGPDAFACADALARAGATVVVVDDGLAARHLHRDLDVVVVDARFPRARGWLPMGERRERASAPARADLTLVHHGGGLFTAPGIAVTRTPARWQRAGQDVDLVGPVAAFCGLGRPADFLASIDVPVARFRALADHQPIDAVLVRQLVDWAGELPLVCTAKDLVRIPPAIRAPFVSRDVEVGLPAEVGSRVLHAAAR